MDVGEVREAVERIRAIANDDEAAHEAEDDLYEALLRSIAGGTCADPAACAKAALATKGIGFFRWTA
jgi:hypothetical protein